jgi:hypothetical protein
MIDLFTESSAHTIPVAKWAEGTATRLTAGRDESGKIKKKQLDVFFREAKKLLVRTSHM